MNRSRNPIVVLFLIALITSNCSIINSVRVAKRIGKSSVKNSNYSEKINFRFVDGHILVDAKIGTKKTASVLILDTGAPTTVSPELSKELGLKKIKVAVNKEENGPLKNAFPIIDSIRVGSVLFLKTGCAELEMSRIINSNCKSADGILGSNMMKKGIWQINYETQEIRFADQIAAVPDLDNAIQVDFTPAPFTGTPMLSVAVNDSNFINLIIDTGFNGFISFETADKKKVLQSTGAADTRAIKSLGYGSVYGRDTTTSKYYIIRGDLKLGNQRMDDLPMTFGRYRNTSERKQGVIGNDFLSHFIVTIDWLANKIYFKPVPAKPLENNLITYGIKYGFENGKLIIGAVFENSAAEKNGLQIGDEIKSFDGTEIKSLSQSQVCTFSETHEPKVVNRKIDLVILRNNKETRQTLMSYLLF